MENEKKLSLVKTDISNEQIKMILGKTPARYIYKRQGKGGKIFEYVSGGYVRKALNYAFGFLWDFEIKEHGIQGNQIWVLGKLTIKNNKFEPVIVKEQFGRADIKFYQDKSKGMLDFGNDLKSAGTDALKKCASEVGIASDIYYRQEWNEIKDEEVKEPKEKTKTSNIELLKKIIPGKTDKEKLDVLKKHGIKIDSFNITQKEAEVILRNLKQNNGNKNIKK